jgi:phospholipase/carboxylesterase
MNRSRQTLAPKPSAPGLAFEPEFVIESALFTPPSSDASRALFAPLHYEPNYAYPLIVWLHGPGNDEWQLMRIMPLVSMRNYVAVAPRGFCAQGTDQDSGGWGWSQAPERIHEAEQRVFDAVEAASQKFNVAPQRIFLAGFDCGGTMAYRVAMNHPSRFAGVISLGGAFPSGQNPFGQWTQARRLGVFLGVGRDSFDYPPERVCEDLRLFHTAGISITLRQYPCGHQLSPQMLTDLDRWIMEQITAEGSRQ